MPKFVVSALPSGHVYGSPLAWKSITKRLPFSRSSENSTLPFESNIGPL